MLILFTHCFAGPYETNRQCELSWVCAECKQAFSWYCSWCNYVVHSQPLAKIYSVSLKQPIMGPLIITSHFRLLYFVQHTIINVPVNLPDKLYYFTLNCCHICKVITLKEYFLAKLWMKMHCSIIQVYYFMVGYLQVCVQEMLWKHLGFQFGRSACQTL